MAEEITVGGITVPLTHPDKVLFPGDGITKADLARYYADVAGAMLPWISGRPVSMVRYPDGLDGERFFQKNAPAYFPRWIRRVTVGKEGGEVGHVVCDKPATLVYLANQACIKDKRGMRIYADVMRNAYAQIVVASYGLRARPGAPVATPLSWAEVEDDRLVPGQFTMAAVRARIGGDPECQDPWAGFAGAARGLGAASKRLARLER